MKKIALAVALGLCGIGAAVVVLQGPAPQETNFALRPVRLWALDLNNPSPSVREKATQTVRLFGPQATPDLVRLLRTPDPVLARPVKAIAWRAPKKVSSLLRRLINPDEAGGKRAAAVLALRTMGTNAQAALPALRRALGEDQTVSWHAALALAELGPDGLSALIQALPASAPSQAGFICYALSTQGPNASNAVPVLTSVLLHGPVELADKAASALSSIGQPAVPNLIQALASPDAQVHLASIHALAAIGPLARNSLPQLLEIAKEDRPAARLAAIEALGQIRPTSPDVVATLARALQDPIRAIRLKALEGLSRSPTTSTNAVPAALAALRSDTSPEIRGEAATLLGEIGLADGKILPALLQAVGDTNEVVRTRARQALDKLHQRSS